MSEHLHRGLTRTRRWLIPAALLALAPKCLLCLLAYAGIGTVLGLGGPEICGAPTEPSAWWLPTFGVALSLIGLLAWSRRHHAS